MKSSKFVYVCKVDEIESLLKNSFLTFVFSPNTFAHNSCGMISNAVSKANKELRIKWGTKFHK